MTLDRNETFQKLVQQADSVVKPLVNQCTLFQHDVVRLKQEKKTLQDNLKKLNAVLRFPVLTDKYTKKERERSQQRDQAKQEKQDAFNFLISSNYDEKNPDVFVDELSKSV